MTYNLVNIRYCKENNDNSALVYLLRCPSCDSYNEKPDTRDGLMALLQHCKRSHNEHMASIRDFIYNNNKKDEELIKGVKKQEKRKALSNIYYYLFIHVYI